MVQTLRERLTLLLLALLPFHAFLVTVGTRLIAGKGHAPLSILAVWKEGLLGVILVLIFVELFASRERVLRITYYVLRVDAIDVLIFFLLLLGGVVTVFTHGDWKLATLGFKYDFIPLVAFLIARRVQWSESFQRSVIKVLLTVGSVVAAYGILTVFLPTSFFQWLGYGPAHSLYFADGPLAAFQQVSETTMRRIQSTMSGPNQMGLWLLIPLGALLALSAKERSLLIYWLTGLLVCGALFFTFSRSAWIAAFVMVFVSVSRTIPRRFLKRVMLGGVLIIVALAVTVTLLFPSVFFRLSSSRGHIVRPLEAIGRMIDHPFGTGLGSAGPASNRVSETCVFLRPQDDPVWAKSTPALCVFLGTTQVQPADHACRCPFLPENWYLQVGVELGVIGLVLFIAVTLLILRSLGTQYAVRSTQYDPRQTQLVRIAFLVFLGVSIAALVLHAWEDSAVAYTVWVLAAVALPFSRSIFGAQQ